MYLLVQECREVKAVEGAASPPRRLLADMKPRIQAIVAEPQADYIDMDVVVCDNKMSFIGIHNLMMVAASR